MHPRNIYKKPVDYHELSDKYPEFSKVVKMDITGKLKVDFKDPESLRVFTKCCLLKDFNLDITLPPEKLLPTIPLRLNYLHWMEDLLKEHEIVNDIWGIDIGCGASCIYCLLAVRMNSNWKMFALEVDDENVNYASDNIKRNHLNDRVSLITQENNKIIFKTLFEKFPEDKTFCICNPPFFKSHDEFIGENRSGKRKASKSAGLHSGSPVELIYEDGGEFGFVNKMFTESLVLKEKVKIYSTMIGCKKNLLKFINELRKQKVDNFVTTEFVQGKTMRWGIAWSFCVDLKAEKSEMPTSSNQSKTESRKVLSHQIASKSFNETFDKIKSILADLEINLKIIDDNTDCSQCELFASKNTWSNQRAKRRAEARNRTFIDKIPEVEENLQIGMEVRRISDANAVELKMFYLSGNMNKDSVNQILQFIKNKI